jgi:hypothetical protein
MGPTPAHKAVVALRETIAALDPDDAYYIFYESPAMMQKIDAHLGRGAKDAVLQDLEDRAADAGLTNLQ